MNPFRGLNFDFFYHARFENEKKIIVNIHEWPSISKNFFYILEGISFIPTAVHSLDRPRAGTITLRPMLPAVIFQG